MFADRESRRIFMYDKGGHTVIAFGTVRHRNDDVPFRMACGGDEHFCSVQDIIIAVSHCHCLYVGGIGPHPRLSQREADQLVLKSAFLIFFLLFRGAVFGKQAHAEAGLYRINNAGGRTHFGYLFKGDHIGQVVAALAAFGFRISGSEKAVFEKLWNGLLRESLLLIQLRCQWSDFIFGKLPCQLTYKSVFRF